MEHHNHKIRPMHGITGAYCGECGRAIPVALVTIPTTTLVELAMAFIAMRGERVA